MAELQRLLDDPAGFRLAPAPALSEADAARVAEVVAGSDAGDGTASPDDAPAGSATEPEPEAATEPEPEAPAEPEPVISAADEIVLGDARVAPAIEEVDHATPGITDPEDSGPPTAPVATVDVDLSDEVDLSDPPRLGFDQPVTPEAADSSAAVTAAGGAPQEIDSDDAFLDELRRAMADQEPLGPREDLPFAESGPMFGDDRRGWRFGKRR